MLLNETVSDKVYFAYRKAQIEGMETPEMYTCIRFNQTLYEISYV